MFDFPPFQVADVWPFDLASLAKEERLGNWFAREQWSKSRRLEWNKQRWQRHLLWQLGRKPGPASLFSPVVLCCYSYIFDCFNCNTRMLWVIFLLSKLIFYSQPLLEVTQNRVVGVEGKMSSHAMIHLERYPVTPVQEEMSHPWIGSMNAVEDIL